MTDKIKKPGSVLSASQLDSRDFAYLQTRNTVKEAVDLREWDSPVDSQLGLGSCVSNAIASAYELQVRKKYPDKFVELSRLFIYYNSRLFDDTLSQDIGAYIRDGLKAVKRYGVCSEDIWPYVEDKFDEQPSPAAYVDATNRLISKYERLSTLGDLLETLSDGYPIVLGMSVYETFNFVNSEEPIVLMPTTSDMYIGAHAVVIVGYDQESEMFLIKNSYGPNWGFDGYAWLPYEYLRTQGFENWRFEIDISKLLGVAETINQPRPTESSSSRIIQRAALAKQ